MATVKLSGIYKVYEGGVRAVNDFNLDIPDKEFVVFVGPSGCGKSTTLRMIAGLEDITQGKLLIDGEVVNDVDSKNRDIAMVFQSYALYPHMTVYQNMAFGLKLRHTPKQVIDEKVKKAAEILEISDLLSRKPKALSGGQRQRVALGRAIVREPKVFLLDEPLSNLDAKLRVQMRSEITKLHKKLQTTFIYVTHDQTEAMTMGTRIVVMKDGFIQQVDSPIALFEDPCNLFVATFLGSPQMNILDAKLSLDNNILKADLIGANGCDKLCFPDIKRKELSKDAYIGKEVKIGIRPESIRVDDNGPIKASIETVEQLGDETILYCKIDGLKNNLVVKTPFKGHVNTDETIGLGFEMNQIHVFDKDSGKSIMGICAENVIKCKVGDNLQIGKEKFDLPEYIKSRLLPSAFNKELSLNIHVDYIALNEIENSIKVPIHIEFEEQKTDYIAAYFKIKGLDEHFVIKLANDCKERPSFIYLPYDKCIFKDENDEIVISREVIYENQCNGYIKVQGDKTIVKTLGNTFEIPNKPDHKDGPCKVLIKPENANVIFNKKLLKDNPDHNKELPNHKIPFAAYDEYRTGKNNIIYGQVAGGEHYFTFVVPNDFSVYKMNRFDVVVDAENIEIK